MPVRADLRFTSYIPALVMRGYSGSAAIRWLRAQGLPVNVRYFWPEWRSVAGYEKGKWRAAQQPEEFVPPEDLFQPSERYVVSRYTYRFYAVKRDPDTGEEKEAAIHIGTDRKLTIAEARALLEAAIAERPEDYPEFVFIGSFSGAFYSIV